jgi:hypothetical protein
VAGGLSVVVVLLLVALGEVVVVSTRRVKVLLEVLAVSAVVVGQVL